MTRLIFRHVILPLQPLLSDPLNVGTILITFTIFSCVSKTYLSFSLRCVEKHEHLEQRIPHPVTVCPKPQSLIKNFSFFSVTLYTLLPSSKKSRTKQGSGKSFVNDPRFTYVQNSLHLTVVK